MTPEIQKIFEIGGGAVGVIIYILLFVVAVMWIFLPLLMISKFNEVITRLKAIESEAETIANNTRQPRTVPSQIR